MPPIANTQNDGLYTDSPGGRGHATYTYKCATQHSNLFESGDRDILRFDDPQIHASARDKICKI
jgi:hypothetical protein